jgi:MerR family mercuric resistance operon transcriptional regulator
MTGDTIGALAAASRLKVSTVRYYERAGLMPPPERTAGGHRTYTNDHLYRLLFICRARELDFSIEETKALLALSYSGGTQCPEFYHIAAANLKRLREKIAALRKVETILSGAVGQCSSSPGQLCPILELLKPQIGGPRLHRTSGCDVQADASASSRLQKN